MTATALPDSIAPPRAARCALLAGILLVATILRLHHLTRHSLWIDEIASLQLSTGRGAGEVDPPLDVVHPIGRDMTGLNDALPLPQVFAAVARDTHPPLYFVLLRTWREIFGAGDGAARSLSMLCSIFAIVALYDAVRHLHGRPAAFWSAAMMAAAAPQIVFAQETRGYAMLTLFLLCAIAAIARIQVHGPNRLRLAALALSSIAALFTHYVAIPAMLALAVYAIIQTAGNSRRAILLSLSLAYAIFLASWGPILWHQRQNFASNLSWTADDQPGLLWRTLLRLILLPIQFFTAPKDLRSADVISKFGCVLYLAPLILLRQRNSLMWTLLAAAIIGTTAISDLVQHRKSLETIRFTIAAAPAAYALVALLGMSLSAPPQIPSPGTPGEGRGEGFSASAQSGPHPSPLPAYRARGMRWMGHILAAIIVLGCLTLLPDAYDQYWKPDYRGFARQVDRESSPDDLLVIPYSARLQDWSASLLLSAVQHYSAHPHRPTLALSGPISDDTRRDAMRAPAAWLLLSSTQNISVEQLLPRAKAGVPVSSFNVGTRLRIEFRPTSPPTSQP